MARAPGVGKAGGRRRSSCKEAVGSPLLCPREETLGAGGLRWKCLSGGADGVAEGGGLGAGKEGSPDGYRVRPGGRAALPQVRKDPAGGERSRAPGRGGACGRWLRPEPWAVPRRQGRSQVERAS